MDNLEWVVPEWHGNHLCESVDGQAKLQAQKATLEEEVGGVGGCYQVDYNDKCMGQLTSGISYMDSS